MKVLVADLFEPAALDALGAAGCVVVYEPKLHGAALTEAVRTSAAQVLVVRGTTVTAETLTAGSLELVVRAGAGCDAIDVVEASQHGIHVANCPGQNAVAVAELVMGLILALDRHIPDNVSDLRAGRWNKAAYSQARGLAGRTLGLLGFGAIAQAVARRAHAFDMRILVWSRRFNQERAKAGGGDVPIRVLASPQALAAEADVLSVHLALSGETHRFVNAALLDCLRPGALFINTSRAEVVDTEALARAVMTRGIRAGLDVWEAEPAVPVTAFQPSLAALPGVYGTHHIGASTAQAQQATAAEAVRIVLAYQSTGRVMNAVNVAAAASR